MVGKPFWGNYRQVFRLRTGAELVEVDVYRDRAYHLSALVEALKALPAGEPALLIVNFPSNPGGYSPTVEQRQELKQGLLEAAEDRSLMEICDDAYGGLVFTATPWMSAPWTRIRSRSTTGFVDAGRVDKAPGLVVGYGRGRPA